VGNSFADKSRRMHESLRTVNPKEFGYFNRFDHICQTPPAYSSQKRGKIAGTRLTLAEGLAGEDRRFLVHGWGN
jgi:hypothetical protein